MKKIISVLLSLLVFLNYGCSPKLYDVVYDGSILDKKPTKELSDLKISKREDSAKRAIFNVEGDFVYRYPKFSDNVTMKSVKLKYDPATDFMELLFLAVLPIIPIVTLISGPEEMGKNFVDNERIFDCEEAIISKKLYRPIDSKEIYISLLPFYSPGVSPKAKSKRKTVPLSSVYSGDNVGKTKYLPKSKVPIRFYYGKRFILSAKCSDNIAINLEKYAKEAFLSNRDNFKIKAVVGDRNMKIKGVNEFYYTFSTRKFMPEYKALKETIESYPEGAYLYAGESKDDLKLIGKTPYCYKTEEAFDNKLNAKYYQIKKSGYRDSRLIYSSETKENRNISVNLEKINYGYLNFSSNVSDVKIYINGKYKTNYILGNSSNFRLETGNYELIAKKAGYHDIKRNVVVGNEVKKQVNLDLQKIEFGFLKITSVSGNVKIFVDNKFRFQMSGSKPKYLKLEEGIHNIKAVIGNTVTEKEIIVNANGNESISF